MTTLNEDQIKRFKTAIYWYGKTVGKISKRYHRGIGQNKETQYAMAVADATQESDEIDFRYKLVLLGQCRIEQFKDAVSDWFYKVKKAMDLIDVDARKAGEPWCDYDDQRRN